MIRGLFDESVDARTIVIALGGNALSGPAEAGDIASQFAHTRSSLAPIVALARAGWRIAIVHGNGPQIGDAMLRHELAREQRPMFPLGVLVASTAGWIGYMIQQSLQNALKRAGVPRFTVTLITQTVVAPPPTGMEPVKPIGRALGEEEAAVLREQLGWTVAQRDGKWRRLVPSPPPIGIVEREQIRILVDRGVIVIVAGGGGTPAYRMPDGALEGVDAVVDKDRAAQAVADEIGADVLLIVTNVDGVYADFGTPRQRLIRELNVVEARDLLSTGQLGSGSMAPKVEAAVAFVSGGTGRRAHIAALEHGLDAVTGNAGTVIVE